MCDGYQSPPLFAQCQCLISQVKTLGSFQIMIITISVLLLQISFEIYILKTPPQWPITQIWETDSDHIYYILNF